MVHIMASDFNERHFMSKYPVYMSKTFPKHRMTVPKTGIYQDIRYQKKTHRFENETSIFIILSC